MLAAVSTLRGSGSADSVHELMHAAREAAMQLRRAERRGIHALTTKLTTQKVAASSACG